MAIHTLYSESLEKIMDALVYITWGEGNHAQILAYDPCRLYNDANHHDITLHAVTFKVEFPDGVEITKYAGDDLFICNEDPADWE